MVTSEEELILKLTQILMDEHRVIEVVLSCLEKIAGEATNSGRLDEESANQAIDVIRTFADKCHHGKEENHLFVTLVDKGMPKEGGPVGQMLLEHEQGRAFVRGMAENVAGAVAGDGDALRQFAQNANGYVALLRAHILKEHGVLFPMADRVLSEEDQKQLMRAFESVESDHMGTGTHEKYLAIVDALAKKYGVESGEVKPGSCGCSHHSKGE
jgi:hemerythrin-like domain-containing protein